MVILNEMAMSRGDAIDLCISLGEKFIEHFNKIVELGLNDEYFNHHCVEMQAWFDRVNKIKLKTTNKNLTIEQLVDWFFTCGENIEDVVSETSVELYNNFIIKLLGCESVKESFLEILGK